ncbi:MAG: response regulator [Thiotrichales bacterium]|nr:response regulator [Thiotrichales bacterium]
MLKTNRYALNQNWIPPLGLALLLGLGWVFWNNFHQNKLVSDQIALDDAKNFTYSVSQFRNFYANTILPPLQKKGITVTHDYHNLSGSVPLPATFATDFGEYLSSNTQSYKVRLFSDLPFSWRENGGIRDAFEAYAMEELRKNPTEPVWRFEEKDGQILLRYAIADTLGENCVSCHNSYPGTPKTDWKTGDVRGVLEVTRPISGLNQTLEKSAQKTFAVMMVMALVTFIFISLILKRLRNTLKAAQQLVAEKTEINDRLNSEIFQKDQLAVQLESAKNRALESSKMKSEFLANMSHEVRTPMNGIIGMTALLKETPLNEQQADWLNTVSSSANALLALLNDILDFSKIEAGKLQLDPKAFELEPLIQSIVKSIEPKAAEKNLSLAVHIEKRLPEWIISDDMRIRQILLNILGNAIKFTHTGAIQLFVTSSGEHNDYLKISVQDTGIGIPEFAKQKLFQAFSQVDGSTTRLYGGTGLGLTISQQLATLLGGEMGFESQEGTGSTFWFTLKLTPTSPAENPIEPQPLAKPSTSDSLAQTDPIKILLVEDNLVNQKLAIALLNRLHYDADIAENGAIALEKLINGHYDLVLMDCQMPVKDGYQTTQELRKWDSALSKTPVIAMTANAMQGDEEKCYAAGMDDYIPKPINPKVLAEKLAFWHAYILSQKN